MCLAEAAIAESLTGKTFGGDKTFDMTLDEFELECYNAK